MRRLSGWRRIADAVWSPPNDPQIYGAIDIDATRLLLFVDALRSRGHRVTVTHVVGRAMARAIAAVPEVNVRLLGGYAVARPTIDIFFISSVSAGHDLSGVKIERADQKSVTEIGRELTQRAGAQKAGRDPDLARSKRVMQRLPKSLLRLALRAAAFVAGDLDLSIRSLGLARSPFGSAMVSSVGSFGLPMGFVPIVWMYRVPLLVLVGEIATKPAVVDGTLAVRRMLPICATIDHRYVDGWHISRLLAAFREYLEDPAAAEEALPNDEPRRAAVTRPLSSRAPSPAPARTTEAADNFRFARRRGREHAPSARRRRNAAARHPPNRSRRDRK